MCHRKIVLPIKLINNIVQNKSNSKNAFIQNLHASYFTAPTNYDEVSNVYIKMTLVAKVYHTNHTQNKMLLFSNET